MGRGRGSWVWVVGVGKCRGYKFFHEMKIFTYHIHTRSPIPLSSAKQISESFSTNGQKAFRQQIKETLYTM